MAIYEKLYKKIIDNVESASLIRCRIALLLKVKGVKFNGLLSIKVTYFKLNFFGTLRDPKNLN